jgi:hypothetical protein
MKHALFHLAIVAHAVVPDAQDTKAGGSRFKVSPSQTLGRSCLKNKPGVVGGPRMWSQLLRRQK